MNIDTAATIAKATTNALVVAVTAAMKNHDPAMKGIEGWEHVHVDDYAVLTHAVQRAADELGMNPPMAAMYIKGICGYSAKIINKLADVTTLAIMEWTFARDIPYGPGVAEMFRQAGTEKQ